MHDPVNDDFIEDFFPCGRFREFFEGIDLKKDKDNLIELPHPMLKAYLKERK